MLSICRSLLSLGLGIWASVIVGVITPPCSFALPPADFDGDGLTDLAVVKGVTGNKLQFLYRQSTDSASKLFQLGQIGDRVVVGDFDGDSISDFAVVGQLNSSTQLTWRLRLSGLIRFGAKVVVVERDWGLAGDELVPGDYDGDGRTDLAIARSLPSNGPKVWYPLFSSTNTTAPFVWGLERDRAFIGNVDGDGKDDPIVVRMNTTGDLTWHRLFSNGAVADSLNYGLAGDRVESSDINGDGLVETIASRVVPEVNKQQFVFVPGFEPFFWGFGGEFSSFGRFQRNAPLSRIVWRIVSGQGIFFIRDALTGVGSTIPFGTAGSFAIDPLGVTETKGLKAPSSPSSGTTYGNTSNNTSTSASRVKCATTTSVSKQLSGFVWKPISESDGKLVVVYPASQAGKIKKSALVRRGSTADTVIETLRFVGNLNGGRPTYRAKLRGSSYPAGVILIRQDLSGANHCITVSSPGSRVAP